LISLKLFSKKENPISKKLEGEISLCSSNSIDNFRLAHELNLTAQYQAQKIQEASEDIVVIHDQAYETEKNTENANKELEKALQNRKKSSVKR